MNNLAYRFKNTTLKFTINIANIFCKFVSHPDEPFGRDSFIAR